MLKKILSVGVALLMSLCLLCACGGEPKALGTFYTLQEAYENGWLTQDDLMSIAYYYHGGRDYNEDIMDEDYEPAAKMPETLGKTTDKAIRQTYWNDCFGESNPNNITLDSIVIGKPYYGSYNGCIAVKVWCNAFGINTVIYEETVAGVYFFYPNEIHITIWKEKIL